MTIRPQEVVAPGDLENSVDEALAACDGDARAAIRALIVATEHLQAQIDNLTVDLAGVTTLVSKAYAREHFNRHLTHADRRSCD